MDASWYGDSASLNHRREAEEGHDLAHAGAGEAFAAGDFSLALDLACIELALPFLGEPQGWLLPKLLVRDATAPTSAYVVRRACFDDVGFFDEALPARQDWDMWIRLSEKYKMAATPECLVEQGQHGGERVSTSAPKLVEANRRIFEKYAPLRRRFSFILRLRARAKLCSTLGGVHCDFGHSPGRALLSHLQGILAWPLRVSNYLGLLRAVMPARLRRCLDRLTRAVVDCFHRLSSLRSARGTEGPNG